MTITQAKAIDTLLNWLLDEERSPLHHEPPEWNDARLAAVELARAASKTLGAGIYAERVAFLWNEKNASGALRRKRGQIKKARAAQ